MNSFKYLLTLALIVFGSAFSVIGHAVDYKCHCTCKDNIGSWKASCYSTSDCSVCCTYKLSSAARSGALPKLVETAQGKLDTAPSKETSPQKAR